jgi:hypothetical protein
MLDLDPIKARLAAAKLEPWWWTRDLRDFTHINNVDLVANAPTDLAALVAEVERLRGHVKTADALRLEAAQEHGRERRHWADERHRFAEERIKLVSDYWRIREAVVRHRREAQAVNILVEPALADARLWAEVLE